MKEISKKVVEDGALITNPIIEGKLIESYDLGEFLKDDNWNEAFSFAVNPSDPVTRTSVEYRFTREDVAQILLKVDGQNDGENWVGVFALKIPVQDYPILILRAGCDYTGWDCQASGSCEVAKTFEDAVAYCLVEEERNRLKIQI